MRSAQCLPSSHADEINSEAVSLLTNHFCRNLLKFALFLMFKHFSVTDLVENFLLHSSLPIGNFSSHYLILEICRLNVKSNFSSSFEQIVVLCSDSAEIYLQRRDQSGCNNNSADDIPLQPLCDQNGEHHYYFHH